MTGLNALDCFASSEYDATTLDRMLPDTDEVTVVRSLWKAKRNETARCGRAPLQHKGETTSWRDAVRRHRREGVEGHTFLFGLSDGTVIDGSRGGNSAR
jgi:hypothetical protein